MNTYEERAIAEMIVGGLQAIEKGVRDAWRSGIKCLMPDDVKFNAVTEDGSIEFYIAFTGLEIPEVDAKRITCTHAWPGGVAVLENGDIVRQHAAKEAEAEIAGTA